MKTQWQDAERARFFDEIPSGVVVIDKSLNVVDHNRAFGSIFGECRGTTCYAATRRRKTACDDCPALSTFKDGRPRVVEQTGTDRDGRDVHLLIQLSPVTGDDGEVEFVAAIAADVTATKRLQQEYQTLFENVPCFVAVINRDYRVVKANKAFCRVFGEPAGEHCYKLYKDRHDPCPDCPAERTFSSGDSHTSYHMGVSRDGERTPYLVSTAPLIKGTEDVTHVIEMALDMTEHQNLEEQLGRANIMREALVENTRYGILVFDADDHVVLANRSAEALYGMTRDELIGRRASDRLVPGEILKVIGDSSEKVTFHEGSLVTADGDEVPARFSAVALDNQGDPMGSAVTIQDLREIKTLERAKLDAERLAAVGQTVAGLAHGIKNILTGLEGGMYVTSTGLKKGDEERIRVGWEMLERNMTRISSLTRNLLAFSRGDRPCPRIVKPGTVVHDVVGLFRDRAEQYGIEMAARVAPDLTPAPIDPEGMHSCLANLVSNAVDACLTSNDPGCTITVSVDEHDGVIVYEVTDTGCGMDYEVKQKAFTSFFTTKGKGGTGLGLLLTRKIVQQHGGTIDLISKPGEGTTFRMEFARDRLPEADYKEQHDD